MPSSISISARPVRPRRRISPSAQATSNRLWLATPTSQASGGGAVEEPVEQRLVAGVDLGLGGVRRRCPPGELGVDVLHRQVGALDEPDLDRRPAGARGGRRPTPAGGRGRRGCRGGRPAARCRREVAVRRLVEHGRERVDREVQVAVLLHVEVDEHRRRLGGGDVVHGAQAVGDARQLVVVGEDVDAGAEGRDLHRHVVDVGAADARLSTAASRAAASSSPRMASPSTLTLRSKPAARRRAT